MSQKIINNFSILSGSSFIIGKILIAAAAQGNQDKYKVLPPTKWSGKQPD